MKLKASRPMMICDHANQPGCYQLCDHHLPHKRNNRSTGCIEVFCDNIKAEISCVEAPDSEQPLRNCPFCGSDQIAECDEETPQYHEFWHRCIRCCASTGRRSTRELAKTRWNTRSAQ